MGSSAMLEFTETMEPNNHTSNHQRTPLRSRAVRTATRRRKEKKA